MIGLHWLPIAARIEFKLCLSVYNALNGLAPSYITDMLQPVTTFDRQVTLRSADNNDLFISRSRLRLRAFCIAAPRARNSLPSDVKSADTVKTFEKRLKILLFSKHYFHSHLIAILCFMLYFASILQLVGTCCKLPCLDMI